MVNTGAVYWDTFKVKTVSISALSLRYNQGKIVNGCALSFEMLLRHNYQYWYTFFWDTFQEKNISVCALSFGI